MRTELKTAVSVLDKRAKCLQTIAVEVRRLTETLEALQTAQRAVEDAEAQEALGSAATGAVAKSRAKVNGIEADIAALAQRLAGLRRVASSFGAGLAEAHTAIVGELPAHNAEVVRAFTIEWNAAGETFGKLMGRRAAIEALTGTKLVLPNPAPVEADLGPIAEPDKQLKALAAALSSVRATAPVIEGHVPGAATYVPGAVYELARPFQDGSGPELPAGTLVIDASFEPGWLKHLISITYAYPAADAGLAADQEAARWAGLDERRRQAEREAANPQRVELHTIGRM